MTINLPIRLAISATFVFAVIGVLAARDEPSLNQVPDMLTSRPPMSLPAEPAETGKLEDDRGLFVHFGWQTFLALNWPAKPDARNTPGPNMNFGQKAERVVWETWKSLEELYPDDPGEKLPTSWDDFS